MKWIVFWFVASLSYSTVSSYNEFGIYNGTKKVSDKYHEFYGNLGNGIECSADTLKKTFLVKDSALAFMERAKNYKFDSKRSSGYFIDTIWMEKK